MRRAAGLFQTVNNVHRAAGGGKKNIYSFSCSWCRCHPHSPGAHRERQSWRTAEPRFGRVLVWVRSCGGGLACMALVLMRTCNESFYLCCWFQNTTNKNLYTLCSLSVTSLTKRTASQSQDCMRPTWWCLHPLQGAPLTQHCPASKKSQLMSPDSMMLSAKTPIKWFRQLCPKMWICVWFIGALCCSASPTQFVSFNMQIYRGGGGQSLSHCCSICLAATFMQMMLSYICTSFSVSEHLQIKVRLEALLKRF